MTCFNATSPGSSNELRIALFGPQVTNWTQKSLSSLQFALLEDYKLKFLQHALTELHSLWSILKNDYGIHGFSGAEKLQELRDFAMGAKDLDPQDLTNTQLSSLTVVSQVVNFIQLTDAPGTKDGISGFEEAQGFCVGFLSAAALASANDWADFECNFSNAVRLAACIGIVIDAENASRLAQERATAVHVRWKTAEDRAFLESALDLFPGAYESCTTDDRNVTITLPSGSQAAFCLRMREAKIATTTIGLNGCYHHPRNSEAAERLSQICAKNRELRLPDAEMLRLPLRSTADAHIINTGALHEIAIQMILCKRAHWFQTVKLMINDLPWGKFTFVPVGSEPCVPRSLSTKDNQAKVASNHDETTSLEEIAVVGMACRFPRAENLEQFCQLLWAGETAIGKLNPERFNPAELSREPKLANFWGNFLDSPDAFDHRFFGISGREAKSMDPQQRLTLQVAYEALESSGYCNTALNPNEADVGCYLGVGSVDYEDNIASHDANAFAATGTLRAFISGRISHFFGWNGPSLTFDTACSSSGVAIHTACKALIGRECSMALAGGVNVITSPTLHQNLSAASFLNLNGASRAFDVEANGYCRGEGAAVLVLKTLSRAIDDGNTVLGVIAASAVNQGSNHTNITVPDSQSQCSLYKRVLSAAQIEAKEVTYVEAHGTGTAVGDPIEYESVRLALTGPWRDDEVFLGSVKDNIGHTEAASGVAGVVKTLLMMQYKTIPKQPNFVSLNPRIKAAASGQIIVPKATQSWTARRHIALVNNYGAAGSNVALVLRAHSNPLLSSTTETTLGTQDSPSLSVVSPILLSARTANGLQSYMDILKSYLPKVETSIESVAYKIARSHNSSFEHRIAFISANVKSAISVLTSSSATTDGTVIRPAKNPVVLCFGGQTSQNVSVSIDLYERCDLFKTRLDECDAACQTLGLPSIFPGIFLADAIEDIVSLHCMLLSLQVSCANCWIDCGLEVDTVVGHSFGQLAALCVADSISLKDAFIFVSGRARLIQDSWGREHGAMLSVECDKGKLEAMLQLVNSTSGLRVDVACYNGPYSFVLAGDVPSIERAEKECRSFKKTRLQNTHAYHSYLTDDILDHLTVVAKSIMVRPPRIRIETCSARGTWSPFTVEKLVQHTREPVYFADAVQRIASRLPSAIWLEAGSSSPIVAMTRRILALKPDRSDVFMPMELGSADATTNLAKTTCQLWTAGSAAQHWLFHHSSQHRFKNLNLPPYQFDKTSHWIQYQPRSGPRTKEVQSLVTLSNNDNATAGEHLFAVDTSNAIFELAARGHAVTGHSLCPASMYIELAARCVMAIQRTGTSHITGTLPHIEGLTMSAPLGLGAEIAVFLRLHKTAPKTWGFAILSRPSSLHGPGQVGDRETEHATGCISLVDASEAMIERLLKLLQSLNKYRVRNLPSTTGVSGTMVYKLFSEVVEYATYYQGVQSVSASGKEAVGLITIPTDRPSCMDAGICDLLSLDNFLQVAGIHVNCLSQRDADQIFMCTVVEEIIFSTPFMARRGESRTWNVYTRYESISKVELSNDIFVYDSDSGILMLAIMGAQFRSIPLKSVERSLARLNKAPTTTNVVASLHLGNSDDLHDSAYQTGVPSPSSDGLQKEIFKHTFDSPVRQVTAEASPAETVAIRHQKLDQPTKSSSRIQLVCTMFSAILEIPVEEIEPTASLEDLGIDSLLVTEVLAEIEGRFYVSLAQAQLMTCTDVLSVAQLIQDIEITQKHQETIDEGAEEQEYEDKLGTGYPLGSVREECQQAYDHHDSHQEQEEYANLAVVSYDCFVNAKALYDHYAEITGFAGFCAQVFPLQSKLVVQYVVEALALLGCTLQALKPGDEVPTFQFEPRYKKLVSQLYKMLEDAGLVTKGADGALCRTNELIPTDSTSTLLDNLLYKFPKHASETNLVHITAHRLADCLSGLADPLALLFGDSTARRLLEDVYANAPMFRTGTLVLAQYLSMILERVGASRKLKILELGAGTGGTSKHVIETLAGLGSKYKFSYTFSDLSSSLVATARRKFSKWPFMHYTVLDIEKDPDPQFIDAYDIIISTNCIHATKNLVQSCANARKMLRGDGVLCLIELTRNLYWFDLVFGLLEGWWLFDDGRDHAIADERRWKQSLHASGFKWVHWCNSPSAESDILRVITASPYELAPCDIDSRLVLGNNNETDGSSDHNKLKDTLTFKKVDGLHLLADIYYPPHVVELKKTLPVALMIHGGGHIMLSRNDIRPEQTSELLRSGFLPISIDYRLCPETTLLEGPMADVADAFLWIRTVLPKLKLSRRDVHVDADKVVAVGWSTGGHLAMTLAWTSAARHIRPPEAILAFYCPTDYEDPFWTSPNVPAGAQTTGTDMTTSDSYDLNGQILEGLFNVPITGYSIPSKNRALGGWLAPSDARSRLALYMNMHGRTLHILLGGLPTLDKKSRKISVQRPTPENVAAASPLAQIRAGNYTTPTFLIHPRDDDLIPWQQVERTWQTLRDMGTINAELRIVENVPHLFDIYPKHRENKAAAKAIKEGYQFLCKYVGLT